jgi:hypothetical protein
MGEPEAGADYIEARLKNIQATMLTKSNIYPTWILANLGSYGLMAGAVVVLNAIGAFG